MEYLSLTKCILILLIVHHDIRSSSCVSLEVDLTISSKEKRILDKFRGLVEEKLPHDYMKHDIYLIRWLRAKNFDIPEASTMLFNNLKWRKMNGMDTILFEDFSDVDEDFKYYIDTYHVPYRMGVVAYFDAEDWDFRKGVIQGKRERVIRYMNKYLEEITLKVRSLQAEGHNITQYDFVVNMSGFNLITHACLNCISGLTAFILSYENHFPGASNKMYFVNTPMTVEVILNAVKGSMSPLTKESLEFYGTNKAQWQPILFKHIPRENLPTDIGGTKVIDIINYN